MIAADVVAALRSTFESGRTKPLAWRRGQLDGLRRMLIECSPEIERALHEDLGKSGTEAQITEIGVVLGEIAYTQRKLRAWLRPKRVAVPPALAPARAWTLAEPLGVALIIAPWNYPVQLLLAPLVAALAAGDAVLLKPSERAPATASLLARLIPSYLDGSAIRLLEGGEKETAAILAERFDTILYTGNGRVGRIVAAAAAEHLTPVTLELGGKSPVYVDDSTDLRVAATRIAWAKFMNAGQTCVAPDYVLCTPAVAERLVPLLGQAVRELYGARPETNPDYGRIVNDAQFARLRSMLSCGVVAHGGGSDAQERYIAPTVLTGVAEGEPVMAEEIFGPILPIVEVGGPAEAIARIRSGDKPLALSVFTRDAGLRRRFLQETSSGSVGFDVAVAQLTVAGLPFGGVGASGMGAYHGRRGVEVFSHEKSVLAKPLAPDTLRLVYPPFTAATTRFARGLLRKLG